MNQTQRKILELLKTGLFSSDLTPERIAELRRIAEAATPGEWEAEKPVGDWGFPFVFFIMPGGETSANMREIIAEVRGGEIDPMPNTANSKLNHRAAHNAEYIATFDPPTTLALLDALTTERERAEKAERWAKAWKAIAKRFRKEYYTHLSKSLRLILKENPRSAEVAYTGLMLMAAFVNDQGENESVEDCAFKVVAERDALRSQVEKLREAHGKLRASYLTSREYYAHLEHCDICDEEQDDPDAPKCREANALWRKHLELHFEARSYLEFDALAVSEGKP